MIEEAIVLEEEDPELHDLLVKWCQAKKEGKNPYAFEHGKLYKRVFRGWMPIKTKTKPNDPCPCESGKKFKKCCG